MNNSTKKYKCSCCKKLKRKWQFPQRQEQINTKRGHVDYICNNCHNDMRN
jgi:predicted SprT family Zn-dependent metalloprotease